MPERPKCTVSYIYGIAWHGGSKPGPNWTAHLQLTPLCLTRFSHEQVQFWEGGVDPITDSRPCLMPSLAIISLSLTHTHTSKWVSWRNKTEASHANTLNFDTWHGRPFWREARNAHISGKGGDTVAVAGSWKDCLVTRSPRHAVNRPWLGPNCKIQFAEMRSRPASLGNTRSQTNRSGERT